MALVFNAVTKLADTRGQGPAAAPPAVAAGALDVEEDSGGGGWLLLGDVEVPHETLHHLLRGVRTWPGVPPPAGRSGAGGSDEGGGGGWQLQSQDLSNILNAVAKLQLQDDEAVARLLRYVCAIDMSKWQTAGIAQVCNALTRLRMQRGEPLAPQHVEAVMDHLLLAALHVPPHTLNPQAVALLLHALSLFPSEKAGPMVLPVILVRLRSFSGRAGRGLQPQSISMTLNALYRLTSLSAPAAAASSSPASAAAPSSVLPVAAIARRSSHQLIALLVAQTLQLAPSAFSATDLVALTSSFFKGGVRDRRLFRHLATAVQSLSPLDLAAASVPAPAMAPAATGMSAAAMLPAQRPHAIATLLSTFSALGYASKVCVCVCMWVGGWGGMGGWVGMYVCVYVCVYTCTHVCMCVHIHAYIHSTHTQHTHTHTHTHTYAFSKLPALRLDTENTPRS